MSILSFSGNNAKVSLWFAGGSIIFYLLFLIFLAPIIAPDGIDANWPFYLLMLIPGYGLLQGTVGVFRKQWRSFLGITINLFLIFCLVFAIAFSDTGFGPG